MTDLKQEFAQETAYSYSVDLTSKARGDVIVALARHAEAGQLENLVCPECNEPAVSVWFTHPDPDEYRTWFVCSSCGSQSRAQNAVKPRFFTEDRVNEELETRDSAILERATFKKPPE